MTVEEIFILRYKIIVFQIEFWFNEMVEGQKFRLN